MSIHTEPSGSSRTRLILAISAVGVLSIPQAYARLDGAIFTTTPAGEIVNENVRYESKQEVFLDGGPGPNAPGSAAALPAGNYYFQVTNPSGRCLLSSIEDDAGVNGGSCYETVKGKGGPKNAVVFNAEPLECRLFYFDGEDGVFPINATYSVTHKVKGQMVTESLPCTHILGSEYLDSPDDLAEGDTIQLYPFANTPNSGGVYKAWVATEMSVIDACSNAPNGVHGGETGENCQGVFGFIPRYSKTDNFKVKLGDREVPETYDIALRSFHDKNLNCQYDPDLGDEHIANWDFGVTDPIDMRNIYRTTAIEALPITFSVLEQETQSWSVDHLMWFAALNQVNPLNTPFTHFTTFADLREFAAQHNDGLSLINFQSPLACDQPVDLITRDSGEETDDGFIPSLYAQAAQGKKGVDPDPVLAVSFGSVGIAEINVCKVFDKNRNGKKDDGEGTISNWPMVLTIPLSVPLPDDISEVATPNLWPKLVEIFGSDIGEIHNRQITKYTGDDGCVTFRALVPNVRGDLSPYMIEEMVSQQQGWGYSSSASVTFDVQSVLSYENDLPIVQGEVYNRDDNLTGHHFDFHNYCDVIVNFDTKGYWHNKNGLSELTEADRDYVNSLLPYSMASDYFDMGDEPFDGQYSGGAQVTAAFSGDSVIWAAGTWQSEVSHFLVDNNGNADVHLHKEQLAQQLLAFIFNTRHRPSSGGLSDGATIEVNGVWMSVSEIIEMAIMLWSSNDSDAIVSFKTILDNFNNNDMLPVSPGAYTDCVAPFYD
ncbi:hypothetical protein GT360_19305 [Vibrio astriarenae]|uniref:Uncharacterized protein n=1 Tax=Vibrio astriarenae TaxID=1481923 RepID=A0A7Z2YFY3_9VIBR|nr:hypothetical protein [Vibrio astriarenae]QIA65674.1 hypothetical protein GT360_19305 [Vibrio astriarenae]